MQRLSRRERHIQLLLQLANHVEPLPWRLEVNRVLLLALALALGVKRQLGRAVQVLHETRDHALSHVHQVVHVGIGHVELADGEFGVVRHVDLLVSKDTADFKDAVETADNELLQVELGRDTHKEVELEVVVVGDEGLGGGAAGNHRHHRCLNLVISIISHTALEKDDALRGNPSYRGTCGYS